MTEPAGSIDPWTGPYAAEVRDYLEWCRDVPSSKYHPSPEGALKMIYHRGDRARAAQIRDAYGAVHAAEHR